MHLLFAVYKYLKVGDTAIGNVTIKSFIVLPRSSRKPFRPTEAHWRMHRLPINNTPFHRIERCSRFPSRPVKRWSLQYWELTNGWLIVCLYKSYPAEEGIQTERCSALGVNIRCRRHVYRGWHGSVFPQTIGAITAKNQTTSNNT